MKTHFKEGDINEGLINRVVVQFSGKYCSFGKGFKWIEMVGLFFDFIKRPPLQLTAGEYAIKLSVLKLCLRDDLETDTFQIRLADNSWLPFSGI